MKARVRGQILDGARQPRWVGLELEWKTWPAFRDWALANGYAPGLSPDRVREEEGYTASNTRWITFEQNRAKARNAHRDACRCFWCADKRRKLRTAVPSDTVSIHHTTGV